ncbi:MAG: hypothetical protein WC728_01375 [Elusimicrobiota bacterium]
MIELLMVLSLSGLNTQNSASSFQPCVWPNTCKEQTQVAFQPCVWPNTCKQEIQVAQFQPCVWPNTCSGQTSSLL